MKLARAMATVGGLTLVSRIAGFVRDILTAALLGAGPVADAFFVALKLPNFFRRITAEGAFSVSFVPMFSGELAQNGKAEAARFAEEAKAVMIAVMLPLTVLAMVAMPWIISLIAPGFDAAGDERFALAVTLSRVTFPYLLLMSLVALYGGVLNALDRFGPFAIAPLAFNLSLIVALLFLTPFLPSAGHAMAVGVFVAGVLQWVWMVYAAAKAGVRLAFRKPKMTPRVRKLFRLMGPGAIGAGVVQINLFVDIIIASFLPAGSISYLYYADRLYQLPLGVVGIAIGTALLPMLTRELKTGAGDEAQKLFRGALEFAFLFSLPAAAALMTIPDPVIQTLFMRGSFDMAAADATSAALMAYALGLPAFVLVKVLSTAFFANEDTKSPVKFAIIAVLMNITLALMLIWPLRHVGIALATGITAWVNCAMLALALRKRGQFALGRIFWRRQGLILLATLAMCAALWLGQRLMAGPLAGNQWDRLVGLAVVMTLGGGTYAAMVHLTGLWRLNTIHKQLFRLKTGG